MENQKKKFEIEKLFEVMIESVKKDFVENPNTTGQTMIFIQSTDFVDKIGITKVIIDTESQESKMKSVEEIKQVVKELKKDEKISISGLITVLDTFFLKFDAKDPNIDLSTKPSKSPNRQEGLLFILESPEKTISSLCEYVRFIDDQIVFSPTNNITEGAFDGIFSNLLK